MRYRFDLESTGLIAGVFVFAALAVLLIANEGNLNIVKTVDYTVIQESKTIASLNKQLDDKNARIAELEKMQPPDYSLTFFIAIMGVAGLIALGMFTWNDVKTKQIAFEREKLEKLVPEKKEGKVKA